MTAQGQHLLVDVLHVKMVLLLLQSAVTVPSLALDQLMEYVVSIIIILILHLSVM